jgi:D-alanine-D-alanine ligase-like ATP-grasp enzyme
MRNNKIKNRYKVWIDEACRELKMDITAMDVLVDEKGNEFILEINSSAIGLNPRYQEEDSIIIRDLVIRRFESFSKKEDENSKQPVL